MATITHMRKVFLYKTELFWYVIPCDLTTKFFDLMREYRLNPSDENREIFIKAFGEYRLKEEHLQAQDFYVIEKGIFHKTNDTK